MGAILIWSFLVGSLGLAVVIVSSFMHRYQLQLEQQQEEEEEVLTRYQSKDDI